MTEATISSIEPQLILPLFGARDQHLRRLREQFGVDIIHRNGKVKVSGENEESVSQALEAIHRLTSIIRARGKLTPELYDEAVASVSQQPSDRKVGPIDVIQVGREVRPKTKGQQLYVEAIRKHELVFAVGPAGTGKTYLAVAMAVEALKNQRVKKIVLVRPAVEAGENLGFLPGDLQAKINPYLRPLLDATYEMMGYDQVRMLMERDVIEVAPLAYMRGRTLNDAFIILDEAQNTTVAQMKMFLTRMGMNSRIVVSGDVTQVDLPRGVRSGLSDALERLNKITGVARIDLTRHDIVRHRLVQAIIDAYEASDPEPQTPVPRNRFRRGRDS
ncbi:MAG TPA: PhoH family protein [Pirellulaceae bacterium]|nr:PhoH family protein [Pirellulaceae bacterium]HMO91387.1 PhoH family protein [Pirellulaceae bacterium]HMP69612.1 PhoH family protein [Pirellulaceae bacterium]